MHDIADGLVWKQFHHHQDGSFFTKANNYGLVLNLDWFQPFKHRTYSVCDLPRYKRENIIFLGAIQGPREPSKSVNSFLTPLVEELLLLWYGVEMVTPSGYF